MNKKMTKAGRPIIMPHPWGELANFVGGTFKLAEKFGVDQATINRWSRGESRVPILVMKELEKLCKYHSIEFSDLKKID